MREQRYDDLTKKLFQNTMLTLLVAELSGAISAVIDGSVTGTFLGPVALASCGIGTPYFSIASILSGILMVGSTALCTRAVGKGDTEEATRVFSLTIFLGLVLSLLLTVLGLTCSGSLAALFGAKESFSDLHAQTAAYLRGTFLGTPCLILFVILTPFLQLDGDSMRPKAASIVMAAVDVAGDLVNALLLHGGMFGMGLATSLGYVAALLVLLGHFRRRSPLFRLSFRHLRLGMAPALMRDGLPRAACMLCRGLLPILLNSLALRLAGDLGVSAYSTMNSSSFVVGSLGWGIGGAVLIMGGMAVGEQDVLSLKTVVKTALFDILFGVSLVALTVFAAAPGIALLFLPDAPQAHAMAVTALRCYAISLPFLAFNVMSSNYFQCIARRKGAYLVNICIEFACTAVLALVLTPFFGITGVWLAFPAGQALLCAGILLTALLGRDRNRTGLAALMLLPSGFGVPERDCIKRSIHSMEEVIALSIDVNDFCTARGISKRDARWLSLCVEEMGGNVIKHGFSDGKPHLLEICVVVKDGQTILRLRDDCALFDLREMVEHWRFDPEHPERNIGIHMVTRAAKDFAYTNTMKTNNVIFTI